MRSVFEEHAESLERFFIDAVQDAVIATEPDGTILLWNPAAEALYGWSATEVAGKPIDEVTVPTLAQPDARQIMERLRGGMTWAGDFYVRRKDGTTFLAEVRNSPVLDRDGRLVAILGISRDVERQRAWEAELQRRESELEDALTASEQRGMELERREQAWQFLTRASQLMSESLDDKEAAISRAGAVAIGEFADWCAIHLVEAGGTIRRAAVHHRPDSLRPQAADLLTQGADLAPVEYIVRRREPILIPRITEKGLVHGGMRPDRAAIVASLGIGSAIMVPLVARDEALGCVSFVRGSAAVPFTKDDLWIAVEFGHRAGLAIQNARLFQDVRDASRIKDELLGLVSHEFRTPITAIQGNLDVLWRRWDELAPELRRDVLAELRRNSDRLSRLIQDMLTLARGEHAAAVESEPLRLQRLLPQFTERLHDHGGSLLIEVPPDLPIVLGVEGHIEQVMDNLLSNARKYGREDGRVAIAANYSSETGMIVVTVANDGERLDPAQVQHFFEPFHRAEEARARAPGAGLGLAVCATLIRVLGGDIWAQARPEGGLAVSFSLPATGEHETGGQDVPVAPPA